MANALQQPEVDPGNGFVSEEARRLAATAPRRTRAPETGAQPATGEHPSQRTSHPARRAALEAALAQIEGADRRRMKLNRRSPSSLGWDTLADAATLRLRLRSR